MKAILALVIAAGSVVACSAVTGDGAESSEQAQVVDIAKMVARGDGTFDVTCKDGRTEIVSAEDVTNGRVCRPVVVPASPFESAACSGAPMTEAVALARLGDADSVTLGRYTIAFRRLDPNYQWDLRSKRYVAHERWVDAPKDSLVAWRETGISNTSGIQARFSRTGTIELARDAKGPFLRMVGEPAHLSGPDTTKLARVVSEPIRPWTGYFMDPRFAVEVSTGEATGSWQRQWEAGWSVQVESPDSMLKTPPGWYFAGQSYGASAIVTSQCGQFISQQPTGGMASLREALGIYFQL